MSTEMPENECPHCAGKAEGQWMDLCDDHLRECLRPALAENDARREAAR